LRALGGFRSEFFMYLEDVELCLRARRHGIPIAVVPLARAVHLPPNAGPASLRLEYHKFKNLLATYLLHAPLRALPAVAARYVVLEAARRLRGGPAMFAAFVRACAWELVHAASLVRDRGRLQTGRA